MTRAIIPIANMHRRLPELGKLKFGDTKAKGGRRTIDKWRVLSNHQDCLAAIAELYGGTPKPFSHDRSDYNFDLHTDSAVLAIGLPTYTGEAVTSACYEMWDKGGCQRRCDGETCTTWVKGPEGPEEQDQPCICSAQGSLDCSPKLRASFFLPGIPRFGVWRLETGSWNAIHEMQGMADLLVDFQARGITEAELALDKRHDVKAGTTRNFVVPEIRLSDGYEAIATGKAKMTGSLTAPAVAQIEAGGTVTAITDENTPSSTPPASLNDQIVARKEVIVPDLMDDDDLWARHNPKARALADKAWPDDPHKRDDHWHATIAVLTDGRTESSKQLTAVEWGRLIETLEELQPDSELTGPEKTKVLREARRLAPDAPPAAFTEIDPGLLALAMGVLDG